MLSRLRSGLSVLVELCGLGALVAAAWLVAVPLGLAVLGAALMYVAQGI